MQSFQQIKEALEYIDGHLDEALGFSSLAYQFHFSPYYFHRLFSAITGKTITLHIRDRRLQKACFLLSQTTCSVVTIALSCGFSSSQAFSRTFKNKYGLTPTAYRKQGLVPDCVSVEDLIRKFTNRLKGGVTVAPNIIKKPSLIIAGTSGDGFQTAEVWNQFEALQNNIPLEEKLSDNGYEVRLSLDGSTVHVGALVAKDHAIPPEYEALTLPPSKYASFDVYVANGYDSENNAIQEWLSTNQEGYRERRLNGAHYCVEFYDERFQGEESGSIVELWIPVEKGK